MKEKDIPMVSIVIPVYNSEKCLPTVLDSIVNQTYKNIEIIIVNNGSSGNVKDIFELYRGINSSFQWKLVELKANVGLFHARIKGWEQANGDYLATIDSDDYVSVDYYYQLVKRARETQSDIVMADYVHDFTKGKKMHYPLNIIELQDVCWENGEALKQFFQICGRCFNMHANWNKIYARELFEKAKPYFFRVQEKIVLSEDILCSCIYFALCKKVTNVHDAIYYHVVSDEAESTNIASTSEKITKGFQDQYYVFFEMEKFLNEIGVLDKFRGGLEQYKRFFVELLFNNLLFGKSNMSSSEKKLVEKQALSLFGLSKPPTQNIKEWVFESRFSPFNDTKEKALQKILDPDIKCVSFDVFDTLVERPFLNPDDLFEFLSYSYNQNRKSELFIDFALLRREAELKARQTIKKMHPFYREVTLKEIYDQLVSEKILSQEESQKMMLEEINLEYRFCRRRQAGYKLYEFAKRCGKSIACVSDMYLPKKVVQNILEHAGYMDIDYLLISSEERVCKYDGKLFQVLLKKTGFSPTQVMHFGDNYISDCVAPRRENIYSNENVTYIPSARELITGTCGLAYTGNRFLDMFGTVENPTSPQNYLGNRCIAGIAANHIFRNPYTDFSKDSSFDANIVYMGYLNLGSYIFTIAKWLLEEASNAGYDTIHFISRDGYLVKRAYDILAANSKRKCPKSSYLYTSRRAMLPLMINTLEDIDALRTMIDILAYTPLKLLDELEPTISKTSYQKRKEILQKHEVLSDQKFQSADEWNVFVDIYKSEFYSEERNIVYRSEMRNQFRKIIGDHDCTFDVGYSARTESVLKSLLEITVDPFYLYCNVERGWRQAGRAKLKLRVLHAEAPDISEMRIVESFLCTTRGSCQKYIIKDSQLAYQFGKEQFEFQTRSLLNKLQDEAIQFVNDFVDFFPDEWEQMPYNHTENPFRCLIKKSSEFDHAIFLAADFADQDSSNENNDLFSCWNKCNTLKTCNIQNEMSFYLYAPRWKRVIYYLLFDRKTLKEKVKKKLHKHPLLLKICRILYSVPRRIYHLFQRGG